MLKRPWNHIIGDDLGIRIGPQVPHSSFLELLMLTHLISERPTGNHHLIEASPNAPSYLNNGNWTSYNLQLHSPVSYYLGNWELLGNPALNPLLNLSTTPETSQEPAKLLKAKLLLLRVATPLTPKYMLYSYMSAVFLVVEPSKIIFLM